MKDENTDEDTENSEQATPRRASHPQNSGSGVSGDVMGLTEQPFDAACEGAVFATALRWLFQIDIDIQWAAGIGAFSRMLGLWVSEQGTAVAVTHSAPELVVSAALAMALLGAVQVIRAY